jgi:hypothetical protein
MESSSMKELDAPPPGVVPWEGKLKDGSRIVVTAKLWHDAMMQVCRHFGVSSEAVRSVERVKEYVPGHSPVSPSDFDAAPMYTVFKGPAEESGIGGAWELFTLSDYAHEQVIEEAARKGIFLAYSENGIQEPQYDQDLLAPTSSYASDYLAACAYLNTGGRLVKLPDALGSRYFRLYPVLHVRTKKEEHAESERSEEG